MMYWKVCNLVVVSLLLENDVKHLSVVCDKVHLQSLADELREVIKVTLVPFWKNDAVHVRPLCLGKRKQAYIL